MQTAKETVDLKKVGVVILAVAVGVIGWNSPVIYPLKLLVVLFHEAGHAIAAKLVGGEVLSLTVNSLEGGLCTFRYQPTFFNTVVTASAGYLGSAIFGALLLVATLRYRAGKWVLAILCAGLSLVLILWVRDPFAVGVTLALAVVMGLGARFLPVDISQLFALFIAAFTSLYALFDLRDDLWSAERRAGTDAAILEKATHVPSIVWAVLWTLLGVGMLAGALWFSSRSARTAPPS